MQAYTFTPAQQEVLNVLSCLRSDEDLTELKKALVRFLDDRMQREIEALWLDGRLVEGRDGEPPVCALRGEGENGFLGIERTT